MTTHTTYPADPTWLRHGNRCCRHCGQLPEGHHSDGRCDTAEELGARLRLSHQPGQWPAPDATDAPRVLTVGAALLWLETVQRAYGPDVPLTLTIPSTVADLMVLVSSLQLAMRHPHFSKRMKTQVNAFIEPVLAQVAQLDPLLGEVGRLGNDPAHDVPTLPEDSHA